MAFADSLTPGANTEWIDAPTPLEAIAKLARGGCLKAPEPCDFYIRIVLPEFMGPERILEFRLPREAVMSYRPNTWSSS